MKKDKQENVKAARKAIRKEIKLNLLAKLKEVLDGFGQSSKDLEREIEKAAVKLSKKLSKETKIIISKTLEAGEKQKTTVEQVETEIAAKQNPHTSGKPKKGGKAKKAAVKQEA